MESIVFTHGRTGALRLPSVRALHDAALRLAPQALLLVPQRGGARGNSTQRLAQLWAPPEPPGEALHNAAP